MVLRLRFLAPATIWRAFFFAMAAMASGWAAAPGGGMPELAQVGKPNEAEAARLLEQFRRAGVAGEFFFEFAFRTLPRRGEERTIPGRLWGGRAAEGSVFRVELDDPAGTQRLLIRNGVSGAVWRWRAGRLEELDLAASLAPLVAGVEVSAFDLQMPFLYWPEAKLEKITRVFGRPSYAYHFAAPPPLRERQTAIGAARAYLDTQFNALMQTELLGPGGRVLKTFSLISLKKVGDQHIPRQADYRNELTRDKTRFEVTAAALKLRLPGAAFAPEGLASPLPPPAVDLVTRF